ncbi:MAG: hypothetical protein PUC36_04465 [Clostridiales bacterium]|nr:hypothetical protein [Clostridiales bacterium]
MADRTTEILKKERTKSFLRKTMSTIGNDLMKGKTDMHHALLTAALFLGREKEGGPITGISHEREIPEQALFPQIRPYQ